MRPSERNAIDWMLHAPPDDFEVVQRVRDGVVFEVVIRYLDQEVVCTPERARVLLKPAMPGVAGGAHRKGTTNITTAGRYKELAARAGALRISRPQLSQREIASALGCSRSTLKRAYRSGGST